MKKNNPIKTMPARKKNNGHASALSRRRSTRTSREDQIEQGIVMCFLGVQDGLDDPQFCEDISGCVHDELYAFYSREQARSNGVNVGKQIHAYKPKSELSVDERRENVNLAKNNSTCRACGKPGQWAGDVGC